MDSSNATFTSARKAGGGGGYACGWAVRCAECMAMMVEGRLEGKLRRGDVISMISILSVWERMWCERAAMVICVQ